jgi:hypothetical protein
VRRFIRIYNIASEINNIKHNEKPLLTSLIGVLIPNKTTEGLCRCQDCDINNDGPEDVFMVLPERKLAKFYPTVQRKIRRKPQV